MSEEIVKPIKETKELLQGLLALTCVCAEVLKDGVSVQDLVDGFVKINADAAKKASVEQALAGISEVPAEIKDISLAESLELAAVLIVELPKVLEAFKKVEAVPAAPVAP